MKRTFAAVAAGQGAAEALRELRRQAFASEDAREGKAAFLEKRSPRFRGQ
jgi:1,4-dihydroxy-2-naphthoyl-CoA synthase